jgi:hypothetical protein
MDYNIKISLTLINQYELSSQRLSETMSSLAPEPQGGRRPLYPMEKWEIITQENPPNARQA